MAVRNCTKSCISYWTYKANRLTFSESLGFWNIRHRVLYVLLADVRQWHTIHVYTIFCLVPAQLVPLPLYGQCGRPVNSHTAALSFGLLIPWSSSDVHGTNSHQGLALTATFTCLPPVQVLLPQMTHETTSLSTAKGMLWLPDLCKILHSTQYVL